MEKGTRVLFVILLAMMTGCCAKQETKPVDKPVDKPVTPAAKQTAESQTAWELRIARSGNAAITRMYQCITEMYSIGHGRGPVCQQACREYAEVISIELEHPDWNATLGDGKITSMPDKGVCTLKKVKVAHK